MTHTGTRKTQDEDPASQDTFFPHLNTGRSKAAFVGVIWSSLHTLIPTVSAAGVFFFSAYYLSPSEFGVLGLVSAIISFALGFSPLAFGEALVQRGVITKSHANSVFWLTCAFALLLFAGLSATAPFAADYFKEPALVALVPVLALKIPFELFATVPKSMIIRSMKFKAIALRTAAATIISSAVSILLLVAGFGIWALAISQVTASFIVFAMAFWTARWRPGLSFAVSDIRELAHYGVFASGDRMLGLVKLDHIVLGILGGTNLLGLYIFAQRFFNMMMDSVTGALSAVSHTLLSTLQSDSKKALQAFGYASFAATAVGLPMFTGAAFVIDDMILLLFDDKWANAIVATQVFCLAGLIGSTGVIQGALIRSHGKADWWFYYRLIQQVTTVIAVVAAYQFGLTAMAIAIVAKTFLIWPISLVMTTKILDCSAAKYLAEFRGPVLATAAMAVALAAIPHLLPGLSPIFSIVVEIVVGIAVYVPILALLSLSKVKVIHQTLISRGTAAT
ncbi:MAG: lipopolysaccharide biosynthesis protein [Marinosulfonomonas sp.]